MLASLLGMNPPLPSRRLATLVKHGDDGDIGAAWNEEDCVRKSTQERSPCTTTDLRELKRKPL